MTDDTTSDTDSSALDDLTSGEAEQARRLFAALQVFRDAYPEMTVSQAAALLFVASEPASASMSDIRGALRVAASTATRAVLTLSTAARGVRQEPGPGLVAQSVDAKDKRWRLARCTPAGLTVVRRALDALRSAGR